MTNVKELILIRSANVPLVKFKFGSVCVDLIFTEMLTPCFLKKEFSKDATIPRELTYRDYLLQETSLNKSNLKGADCINSFLSSMRLKHFILNLVSINESKLILRVFSEATKIIKCWAKRRGIYNFNLGYLNGISIMIMVAKSMHEIQLKQALS